MLEVKKFNNHKTNLQFDQFNMKQNINLVISLRFMAFLCIKFLNENILTSSWNISIIIPLNSSSVIIYFFFIFGNILLFPNYTQ